MDIDIAGKLFPNITTLIVQLCSTGVMLFVFKKYLWAPVQAYFAKRADFIETQINEAKDMNEKAKKFMQESEQQARVSAREYHEIVERAKSDALKERDDIIVEARKEAASKIEQAQKEIFKYIELYYNVKRMHSSLNFLSPLQYEKQNS